MKKRVSRSPAIANGPPSEEAGMPHPSVLTCKDLMAITGYQRAGDVSRCLRDQGIHVFEGRHGPWTTIELINKAGGLTPGDDDTAPPTADEIL